MRIFSILFFFILISCNPISLIETPGDKTRNRDRPVRDTAEGVPKYTINDLAPQSAIQDIKETAVQKRKDCLKEEGLRTSDVLSLNFAAPAQRCVAKAIEESFAPICAEEEKAWELIDYYEREGDEEALYVLDEYLHYIEQTKLDLANDMFVGIDSNYRVAGNIAEKIDDHHGDDSSRDAIQHSINTKLLNNLAGFSTASERATTNPCAHISVQRLIDRYNENQGSSRRRRR